MDKFLNDWMCKEMVWTTQWYLLVHLCFLDAASNRLGKVESQTQLVIGDHITRKHCILQNAV